ncbi:hypothetical protein [Edaphobacter modestus]|uniref:Uncharacterized protein n=1 Tax=Edaphobacter modestus TaxID=388466 RepID=A0A4V2G4S7_9BACT|nr:hypothetical protein [Edaphobacter modestus]RZU42136.1 hypothetical protein BDD14_3683 [Edaphobacter modestus]
MKNLLKMLGASGFLCLLLTVPGAAQLANGMDFSTDFSFSVGATKLPAGAYTITQSDQTQGVLKVADATGKHSAMVEFTPMQAETPHTSSDVTFRRYGKDEYLDTVLVGGQTYGMKIERSKAEQKAAGDQKPEVHKVSAKSKS